MRDEIVSFYSEGLKVEGLVRRPDAPPPANGYPVIVQGPGYLGLMQSPISALYNKAFVDAGYAVVALNYRGFGNSEGEKGWINPDVQLTDLINTLTFIETVEDLDATRIGVYGHGGTGGGNAIMLTAVDSRVKCVAVQSPIADGFTWLRSMRRNYEWIAYLERVEANARRRLVEGRGEIVNPREEIMVATPQRRAAVAQDSTGKATVDSIVGNEFHLASAEAIMRYRPIDYVAKIAPRPLLVMALHRDAVTPEDHGAQALFDAAGAPKTLLKQNAAIAHYSTYDQNLDVVGPILVDFYNSHLVAPGRLTVVRQEADATGFTVSQVGAGGMTMRAKRINASGYVHPVSTFTQAVEVEPGGRTLYFSGITARNDKADVLFPGDIEGQCRQIFANIKLILAEAGASMDDVVKTNAYVTHADYMEVYRRTKDEAFGRPAPPGTVVQVVALYNPLQLIEIELIAVVHDKPSSPSLQGIDR